MPRTSDEIRIAIEKISVFMPNLTNTDFFKGALEVLEWSVGKEAGDIRQKCIEFRVEILATAKSTYFLGKASALAWLLGEEPKGFKENNL